MFKVRLSCPSNRSVRRYQLKQSNSRHFCSKFIISLFLCLTVLVNVVMVFISCKISSCPLWYSQNTMW